MYKYDLDYVQDLCRLSAGARQSLAKYYIELPETVKIEAFKIQTDLTRQNRNRFVVGKTAEFYYAFFMAALAAMRRIETGQQKKIQLTDEEAGRISAIRLARLKAGHKKKDNPARRLIEIRFFELINRLRGENLSWRDISNYIARFHKHRISHAYLRKVYLDQQQKVNEKS